MTFSDSSSDPATLDPKTHEHTVDYDSPITVPEDELPLKLPPMEDFRPGDDPAGCLARASEWRYFKKDGKWYSRETNTMPQWAGSCWYYLRYTDSKNTEEAWSKKADSDWLPVDLYVGGAEHAVLHLLYARFWHQVLYDLGYTVHPEPFQKLVHQGMILGSDGEKMSKSRGNVVNPDDVVEKTGADSLRLYEMFMGPLEAVKPWQTSQGKISYILAHFAFGFFGNFPCACVSIVVPFFSFLTFKRAVSGVVRFQRKLYDTVKAAAQADSPPTSDDIESVKLLHKTMKKVTEDIQNLSFNTAISALMVLTNHLASLKTPASKAIMEKVALMVSPFAPHLGEECWNLLGNDASLAYASWVTWDDSLTVDATVTMGVQVNGKVRGEISMNKDEEDEAVAVDLAMKVEKIQKWVDGKNVKKVIYRPGKILNIIVG